MRRLRRTALLALCGLAFMLPVPLLGAAAAQAADTFTPLTLVNGWTNPAFSTSNAAVATVYGILHLNGAIATAGTNPVAFSLPSAFRPAKAVFVPVDLCNATNGRLYIQHNGVVTVQGESGSFFNAQCFTSL